MKKQNELKLSIAMVGCAILVMLLLGSCSEEGFEPALTREFSIQSTQNAVTYTIKVGLPATYNSSDEKYATVYLLDGEENFDFVARNCKAISDQYTVANVLVISIGYGRDRSIDYTPTQVSSVTGGGAEFLGFIESQLIPKIELDFKAKTTRESRVILGHSYGGLFGACVLAVDNTLFGNYILLSPSIWFDNEVAMQLEKDNRGANKDREQLVFMGIGAAENSGRMQAPFEAFYKALQDNYTHIKLSKNLEKNLDHVGSKNPNIIKGLDYYFQNR